MGRKPETRKQKKRRRGTNKKPFDLREAYRTCGKRSATKTKFVKNQKRR